MNIIIQSKRFPEKTKRMNGVSIIPRVGDHIDIFYAPHPKVTKVLLWPDVADLAGIDAIIEVE